MILVRMLVGVLGLFVGTAAVGNETIDRSSPPDAATSGFQNPPTEARSAALGSAESSSGGYPARIGLVVAGATAAVSSNFNPSALGQTVLFTANVTAASTPPTGTVDFLDGTARLCSAVALVAGRATCATNTLTPGTRMITALYSGDRNYAGASSGAYPQNVGGASSTLLKVTRDGSGSGSVTSSPPGISCGAYCDEPYTSSTLVTRSAGNSRPLG